MDTSRQGDFPSGRLTGSLNLTIRDALLYYDSSFSPLPDFTTVNAINATCIFLPWWGAQRVGHPGRFQGHAFMRKVPFPLSRKKAEAFRKRFPRAFRIRIPNTLSEYTFRAISENALRVLSENAVRKDSPRT